MTAHDDAVKAAAEALTLIPGTTITYPESVARTVLAAAAPILLAAERQRIAEAIRAECLRRVHSWDDFGQRRVCWTCDNAARIAEGDPGTTVAAEGDR